jgi:hydrogenase maturation factor HypF (carbamoyltransferase family)
MSKQNTKNIFIEKAMLIHGSKYDYSLVEYKNNYTKVKIICIEHDGIQHFKAFKIWGGEIGLLNRQKKDKIKNNFCEDNKIRLIRIAYNEKIEDKLLTENVR